VPGPLARVALTERSEPPIRNVDDVNLSYDELVADALAAADAMRRWDFDYLEGRTSTDPLPWSYPNLARDAISRSRRLLDMDTGGGEVLASLAPLPPHTVATEGWEPNIRVARERLEPLGVEVRRAHGETLPVEDGEFDLVLNRHAAFDVAEVWRALAPGGHFLMQQVGSRNDLELNAALGAPPALEPDSDTCAGAVAGLERQGFQVLEAVEAFPAVRFHNIAEVVYQLTIVSWQAPGFDVTRYDAKLRELDRRIRAEGPLVVHNHRYIIRAVKPDDAP